MKSIDVLVIFENKNRELESALLLKKILISRGYTCELCQQGWSIASARFKWSPKVIVTPWCYDNEDLSLMCSFNSSRKDRKLAIVNLHCEQLVFQDALDFYIPKNETAKLYHCAWGPYYENLLKNAGISNDLIEITGSTRLDFFRKEFSHGNKREFGNRYHIDPEKKWALFVGNFSGAFLNDEMIESLNKRGIRGWEQRRTRTMETYNKTLEWMERVANNPHFKDKIEFIYRPHPSEPITKELKAIVKRNSNITVIKELPIREWYQVCSVAFVWCSTSSIEATCAGIPVYAIEPFKIPSSDVIEIIQGLNKLKSSEEIVEVLDKVIHNEKLQTSDEFIRDVGNYYRIDNQLATARTANFVIKAIKTVDNCYESRIPIANSTWMLIKYIAKLMLMKIGILGHVSKFKTWVDNYASEDDYKYASVIVERCSVLERNRG